MKDNWYLNPRWRKVSRYMLELYGCCQKCGAGGEGVRLNVHHKIRRQELVDPYDENVLQVLCARCHWRQHHKPRKRTPMELEWEILVDSPVERQEVLGC